MQPDELFLELCQEIGVAPDDGRVSLAYRFAKRAHDGIIRRNGDPFIMHSLATAQVTARWGLGEEMVALALLHDSMDRDKTTTPATLQELEAAVGPDAVHVVEQMAVLGYVGDSYEQRGIQEELGRLLEMSHEPRIILLKLASALELARDLERQPVERQQHRAELLLNVYSPLARRFGLWSVKREIEDRCLFALFPNQARRLKTWQDEILRTNDAFIKGVSRGIEEACRRLGLEVTVIPTPRHVYSLFARLQESHAVFDFDDHLIRTDLRVSHAFTLAVVAPTTPGCYAALGAIHSSWKPIADSFQDHIAAPKANGYASLHTSVNWHTDRRSVSLELKIRTPRMHNVAALGLAEPQVFRTWEHLAHGATYGAVWPHDDEGEWRCVRRLIELLISERPASDTIRVLTPEGKPINLPRGAVPLDFAYAVHSEMGHHFESARVNGVPVPLDYRLRDGDMVEVQANPRSTPDPMWVDLAVSKPARDKMRAWFNRLPSQRGERLLRQALVREGLDLRDLRVQSSLEALAISQFGGSHKMLEQIGAGRISADAVVGRLLDSSKPLLKPQHVILGAGADEKLAGRRHWIRIARCCEPRFPDPIVGCVTRHQVVVHSADCGNARGAREQVPVLWKDEVLAPVAIAVQVEAFDRPGLARDVSRVVADHLINMPDFHAQSESADRATIQMTLDLRDPTKLAELMSEIRSIEGVTKAEIRDNADLTLSTLLHAAPEGRPLSEMVQHPPVKVGIPNPYTPGTPITNVRMFYGRQREMKSLRSHLLPARKSTSVLLTGPRRVGKTSLAQRIARDQTIRAEYMPVFVDLQALKAADDYTVLRKIAREVQHVVGEHGLAFKPWETAGVKGDIYDRFEESLFTLHQALGGKRLLLILDEFDALLAANQAGALSDRLWWTLRSWVQNQPVTLMFVGVTGLQAKMGRQCPDIMNVVAMESVGGLEQDDARALIIEPVERHLSYQREVVDMVIEQVSGYPYYIHILCSKMFSEVQSNGRTSITRLDFENAQRWVTEHPISQSYYAHLFGKDDGYQRAILAAVAANAQANRGYWVTWREICRELAQSGLEGSLRTAAESLYDMGTLARQVVADEYIYRIRLPLFRRWIQHNWPVRHMLEEIHQP
ncbi:MAG: HD domain-containing protein [Anaerolineae bacterium]